MTITEFAHKTGFFPKEEHMDRVNCALAGQSMHKDCGCCVGCGIPKSAVCPCRWPGIWSDSQRREDGRHALLWAETLVHVLCKESVPRTVWDLDFFHNCYMKGDSPSETVEAFLEEVTAP